MAPAGQGGWSELVEGSATMVGESGPNRAVSAVSLRIAASAARGCRWRLRGGVIRSSRQSHPLWAPFRLLRVKGCPVWVHFSENVYKVGSSLILTL